VIGVSEIAVSILFGNTRTKGCPGLRGQLAEPASKQVRLGPAPRRDPEEHHLRDVLGKLLGIDEAEHRPLGGAEQEPAVDVEALTQ